jgi:hypothetical protein
MLRSEKSPSSRDDDDDDDDESPSDSSLMVGKSLDPR